MATTTATRKAAPSLGAISPNTLLFILWAVGLALVAGVYYFLFYMPLDEERSAQTARRSELAAQRATEEQNMQTYNAARNELSSAREHAQALQSVLPPEADMPGFMRNINALAEASGLRISLIQPVEERAETYYARIPVQLHVRGTYLGLARFFHAISKLQRVINMENIKLDTPGLDPATNDMMLNASVLATTFRSIETHRTNGANAPNAPNAAPGGGAHGAPAGAP